MIYLLQIIIIKSRRKILKSELEYLEYKGKIKELNHIVVSDPSCKKDMWGRYEKENINGKEKAIEKEIEDNDYLLDSYGIIDEKSSKLSRSNKKVFSEIDFTFIPVTNDEISNDLVQKAIQKNQKIGLIVTPTDCTYASIYKTIDKVKQLVQDYNIECPILYDITKYMSDQYIRANC